MKGQTIPKPLDLNNLLLTPWCQITQQTFSVVAWSRCIDRSGLAWQPKVGPTQYSTAGKLYCARTRCCDWFTLPGYHQPQGSTHFKVWVASKNTLLITIGEKKLFWICIPIQIQRICVLFRNLRWVILVWLTKAQSYPKVSNSSPISSADVSL